LKRDPARILRRFSLRQRFLIAPLLGLVVSSLLIAAFMMESHRQNALIGHMEQELAAFNHYTEIFVNLATQHTALDTLLDRSDKMDRATLYDAAKQHLDKVQGAVLELQQAVPVQSTGEPAPRAASIRSRLAVSAQAYRVAVSSAVEMATLKDGPAFDHATHANARFSDVNYAFVTLLDMERKRINADIAARVQQGQVSNLTIAWIGVAAAVLLFFLSRLLSRVLAGSIEAQIRILIGLGTEAGARDPVDGGHEVERMTDAVAAFRLSLSQLRESERRFSELLGNVQLVSLMLDGEARITYCNDYLLRLTGWRREEVIGKSWFEQFIPADDGKLKHTYAALLSGAPEALHHESEILTRSGERRLIRWNNSVLRSEAGDAVGTASIGEDITEQKRSEVRIRRLNRVYAVLSGINSLIVRVGDRDQLFAEACRIAVEQGEFRTAWIGVVDRDAQRIVPIAAAGAAADFLERFKDRLSLREALPAGNTLSVRAVLERNAMVSNSIHGDPRVLFAKEHLARGIASMAALPLQAGDDVAGVLVLYAGEAGFFDAEEMKLLTELAGDIGFALDHLDQAARLEYLAYYDALTGLANRALFSDRVAQFMRIAAAEEHGLAVFLFDLERFRNINDSLGRPAGDALLKEVAEWLKRSAGDANLVARIGADHFAVVLPKVRGEGNVAALLERGLEAFLGHAFHVNGSVLRISAKVGVALFPADGVNVDILFKHAEAALKKAKASGERYLFYTPTMSETVAGKLTLENQLRQALDNQEFVLHYQPKVSLASGAVIGAEALIRWNDPRTGLVPPGKFIPVLEETGLIDEAGRWALREAVRAYLGWRAAGLPAVRIAVNVSPLQLRNRGFIAGIEEVIGIDPHAAEGLELEITESVIMEDVKNSIATLQAIRAMGVTIAIDDFGTGFSSLSYLAKLPVDSLKIDRSFIVDMTAGPEGLALVSTIISLAHSLKLRVVAEGVETEEQSRLLRLLGCDEMQGFLFSKPVPGETFEAAFLAPLTPAATPRLRMIAGR
jgi:diguanylate cyclase (GGDEF)-like protein/PAS domain S-box-containing protein